MRGPGTVYHFHAASTKPAAATYKQTNRQTAQAARGGRWEGKYCLLPGPQRLNHCLVSQPTCQRSQSASVPTKRNNAMIWHPLRARATPYSFRCCEDGFKDDFTGISGRRKMTILSLHRASFPSNIGHPFALTLHYTLCKFVILFLKYCLTCSSAT